MSSNRLRVEPMLPDIRVSRIGYGRPRSNSGPVCYPNRRPNHASPSREERWSRTPQTNSPVSSPPPRFRSPSNSPKSGSRTGSPKYSRPTLLVTKNRARRKSTTDMGNIDDMKEDDKLSVYSSHTSVLSDPSTGQPLEEDLVGEEEEERCDSNDGSLSSELSSDTSGANEKQNELSCHDNSEPPTDLSNADVASKLSDRVDMPPFDVPQLVVPEELSEKHLLIDNKFSDVLTTPISAHCICVFVPGTSSKLLFHSFNDDSMEYVTGRGVQSKSVTTITDLSLTTTVPL